MTRHETHVRATSPSGILPLSTADLLQMVPDAERGVLSRSAGAATG
jgi:hypothetical protein